MSDFINIIFTNPKVALFVLLIAFINELLTFIIFTVNPKKKIGNLLIFVTFIAARAYDFFVILLCLIGVVNRIH